MQPASEGSLQTSSRCGEIQSACVCDILEEYVLRRAACKWMLLHLLLHRQR